MKVLRDPQILSGYLIEKPFASLPEVTHCGEAICIRGHHLPAHSHPVFEFLVLTRGRASWEIEGRKIAQENGDVLAVFPRQSHRTGRRPNPENQHLWIGLDLARFSAAGARLARALRRRGAHVFPGGLELESVLRGVMAQAIARKPDAASVARCYLETLIALMRQFLEIANVPVPPNLAPCSVPIQRCLAYMERHLDERLRLKDLSRIAAMPSPSHFCTRFRREAGITPAEMHLRLRLNAARESLGRPEASVTEVAMQFGFSSSQHFSCRFRQAFGFTPSAWRNQVRRT